MDNFRMVEASAPDYGESSREFSATIALPQGSPLVLGHENGSGSLKNYGQSTVAELLTGIQPPADASASVVDESGGAAEESAAITTQLRLKVVSADGHNTAFYTFSDTPDYSPIVLYEDADGAQPLLELKAGSVFAKTTVSNYNASAALPAS